ncbi:MAG: NAD(P)-binding domain-containing protein, partial [Pedobacter sp.]
MEKTSKKPAFLGSGNIGMSLAKGLVKANYCEVSDITLTRRNVQNLSAEQAQGYKVSSDNYAAAAEASVVILAVLPQQL